jgi:hypothetical protein
MAYSKEFNAILDRLYLRRTAKLRNLLQPKSGRPLRLSRAERNEKIGQRQGIATAALARKYLKGEVARAVKRQKWCYIRGWDRKRKIKNFKKWIHELSHRHGMVYLFWRRKECRYIGRTGGRGRRPARQFKKDWFPGTTRVKVYAAYQRRSVPRLECLAIHRFQPKKNKIKAAKQKWTPRCPMCRLHKTIRAELLKIYRYPR